MTRVGSQRRRKKNVVKYNTCPSALNAITIELSSVCQDPNVSLSTTFIRSLPILLLSCCSRCVRFESNVLYAYCTPFAEGKLVQPKISCQIYRLVMFLFSGIEWRIVQEIKTIRAPPMI